MDIIFENQYERSKDFYKEMFTYSFFKRPPMMAAYIVFALIFVLCILSLLFPDMLLFDNTAGIYTPIFIITVVVMVIRYVRTVEISYKRDLEINNGEPVEIKIKLTSDVIETCRVNSESKNNISYQSVRKIITTRNYYVLLTEAKQYIVLKKTGFITGTPDEFLPFAKRKVVKGAKKSKIQLVFIILASVIALSVAVSLYIANGRTIFENRAEPTEAELEKIHELVAFEQKELSECKELLSRYDDRTKELGIEIRPVLEQTRAVNNQGLVEKHDWSKDNWLPQFYNSKIICYVYKDGKRLTNQTSYNSIGFFVDIYWLLYTGKNENTTFNENPFDRFDTSFDSLLSQVSNLLQK